MATSVGRKNYARIGEIHEDPTLIEVQLESFEWFMRNGLEELFDEISPIESFNGNLKLYFPGHSEAAREFDLKYWFEDPKYDEEECLDRDLTYASPLYVTVALVNAETGEVMTSDIFLGDFPIMTGNGTFIINGTERVVVSQLIRSPGVYFDADKDPATGRPLASAKLIPDRGAWMEFETRRSDYLTIKFNRKRTIPVTILLRALAAVTDGLDEQSPIQTGEDEELLSLFADVDTHEDHEYIQGSMDQEPVWDLKGDQTLAQASLIEFYKRMRPGDPPTFDNAREYLEGQLFDRRRYDLERVGRYKLNQRLALDSEIPRSHRTISKLDVVKLVERMIKINNVMAEPDDIDHLGNRRVKTVGELIQNKLRVGLRRTERVVRERMSIRESEGLTPITLINIRPIVTAIREFFGSSQLSQFMDQTNPLAELTHKRTLSALGPGGLRRERAGFDVRDVHHSHYGRICPIETPEGPNIGLIGRLATYAKVNEYGFIETPYRRVYNSVKPDDPQLLNRILREDIKDGRKRPGKVGDLVDEKRRKKLAELDVEKILVRPFVSGEIEYLSADEEDRHTIAQATARLDAHGNFMQDRNSARENQKFRFVPVERIDYVDIAPRQIVGISAALIPFLEHDDANRALMGSNMQRQAVPLLDPDVPIVSTGMESLAAQDSGQVISAEQDGEVLSVTGDRIIVRHEDSSERIYRLRKYQRSNQSTNIDQRPVVMKGEYITRGQVLADSSSTQNGELALGHDVLCAFLSWEGGNYEDAILISEEMVRNDRFTSIHIEKHEVEARDTKLGPEEITFDIPNVGDDALKDLDERGIVRVGAEVGPNDILVGKITPKGEKELSPEEKLLRAIFGEKAREVKDSSLRLPHGERGKVVDVRVFNREDHRDLPAGVEQMVRVSVAQRRKLTEGDKMAGRHGNKGVISRVVPIEDMPFLEDGRSVDIILNPLGVPGRMNIGQILETHLGWAAERLGFRAITPVFDGAREGEIEGELARSWLIDEAWRRVTDDAWEWLKSGDYDSASIEDEIDARHRYIDAWLGSEDIYDRDLLMTDEIYARRAVMREWLVEQGYDADALLSFEDNVRESDDRVEADNQVVAACLRLWMMKHGKELDIDTDLDSLYTAAVQVQVDIDRPVPTLGKLKLFDGRTGEPFDRPVTVGIIHMLKLSHLVEDKVHARSTGPYSLVTQQPLGGKAQFGGQRFGEMEVWALEAYGAAYTLQEMLTVKSDDVQGRVRTYESIVKGEPIEEPGIPASFRVLVKELQSLAIAVEAITDTGDVIRFGKDEEKSRQTMVSTGLVGLANMPQTSRPAADAKSGDK